jgi:uncharacterized protein HemX
MLRKQTGVAGVELLLLVAVAALLGFVVFQTYTARHAQVASQSAATQTDKTVTFASNADLTAAQQQLDSTDLEATVDGGESNELDQDLATF